MSLDLWNRCHFDAFIFMESMPRRIVKFVEVWQRRCLYSYGIVSMSLFLDVFEFLKSVPRRFFILV